MKVVGFLMVVLDALLPRRYRCPLCGRRVAGVADHVAFGHTPTEVDRFYAARQVGGRR